MGADSPAIPDDIAAMSFEQALAELEAIIDRLEAGDVDLEQSIEAYARGTLLKAHCEAKLRNAQARIERIVVGADGALGAQPEDDLD
jgi:exodeoxyribonuclease VII small subunit